jgi:hypothetical protein
MGARLCLHYCGFEASRHTTPSLRLFVPNSLTGCHLSFLSRALFATFFPQALYFLLLVFSFLRCSFHRYHRSILKCACPERHPGKVTVSPGSSKVFSLSLSSGGDRCFYITGPCSIFSFFFSFGGVNPSTMSGPSLFVTRWTSHLLAS